MCGVEERIRTYRAGSQTLSACMLIQLQHDDYVLALSERLMGDKISITEYCVLEFIFSIGCNGMTSQ